MSSVSFAVWLGHVRERAKQRGGKRWTKKMLRDAKREASSRAEDNIPVFRNRQPGEIVNPVTGEVSTDCLPFGAVAKRLGVTTPSLTKTMLKLGLVVYVLDYRMVPMFKGSAFRKPRYFHTPDAARSAIENNLLVRIKVGQRGGFRKLLLITPHGQDFLEKAINGGRILEKAVEQRRTLVARLLAEGLPVSEIIERTSFPRRSVFRYVKTIQQVGAGVRL